MTISNELLRSANIKTMINFEVIYGNFQELEIYTTET
jgi:hypothetical protein